MPPSSGLRRGIGGAEGAPRAVAELQAAGVPVDGVQRGGKLRGQRPVGWPQRRDTSPSGGLGLRVRVMTDVLFIQ